MTNLTALGTMDTVSGTYKAHTLPHSNLFYYHKANTIKETQAEVFTKRKF